MLSTSPGGDELSDCGEVDVDDERRGPSGCPAKLRDAMGSWDGAEEAKGTAAALEAAGVSSTAAAAAVSPAWLCTRVAAAAVSAVAAARWPFEAESEAEAVEWPLPAALLSSSADGLCAAWPLLALVPAAAFIVNTIDGRLAEGGDSTPPLAAAAAANTPPAGNAIATAAC